MRISDWSSDVCSSDLRLDVGGEPRSLVPRFCSNEIGAGVDRHLWQSEAEMHRLTRGGLDDIGQPDRADRDMHLQTLPTPSGRPGANRTVVATNAAEPILLFDRGRCRAGPRQEDCETAQ